MEVGNEFGKKRVDEEILKIMATVKSIGEERGDNSLSWQDLWSKMAGEWYLEGRQLRGESEAGEKWMGEYEKQCVDGVEINKIDIENRGETLEYAHIFLARKTEGGEVIGAIVEAKIKDQSISFDSFRSIQ